MPSSTGSVHVKGPMLQRSRPPPSTAPLNRSSGELPLQLLFEPDNSLIPTCAEHMVPPVFHWVLSEPGASTTPKMLAAPTFNGSRLLCPASLTTVLMSRRSSGGLLSFQGAQLPSGAVIQEQSGQSTSIHSDYVTPQPRRCAVCMFEHGVLPGIRLGQWLDDHAVAPPIPGRAR